MFFLVFPFVLIKLIPQYLQMLLTIMYNIILHGNCTSTDLSQQAQSIIKQTEIFCRSQESWNIIVSLGSCYFSKTLYIFILRFSDTTLANILSPKPETCGSKFELRIDDVLFVGHPTLAEEGEGESKVCIISLMNVTCNTLFCTLLYCKCTNLKWLQ